MVIERAETDAISAAVSDGTLSNERANELNRAVRGAALAYVRNGTRPAGEGWQTVDKWDAMIAGVSEVNIRAVNSTLDTGLEPIDWIRDSRFNNLALIVVGIWIWTGFCMVVLSAALKGIPAELLEAARVDGANEFRLFFSIIIPLLMPTLTVVTTTMIINVLKVFDIVYVMTAGNFGTEVIANRMYFEMYGGNREFGHASAIAVVLMLAIVPVMIYNIVQFRRQEARR
ncbi:MAG: sugar ABC transporter permease [Anaerolineae bacterium]|nr:sugar ABC transporter permease [Anaerolineae bacterium]